ncbi:MAG: response regulator [Limisphaerales bacterium]
MLIDDAQHDLDAQRRTLESCKLLNEIVTFKAGEEALAYFRNARQDEAGTRFLIFLDLVMRPVDGTTVLRTIHDEKLCEGSIIVMLSGLSDVRLLHEGYQLGAHTFLVKPLNVQDVMELLSSLKNAISFMSEPSGNSLGWQTPWARAPEGS